MPILSQSLPLLQEDSAARQATVQNYNTMMVHRYGLGPVTRSRSELALKSANAPADAVSLGNEESLRGFDGGALGGSGGVPRTWVAGAGPSADSQAARVAQYTQQARFVAGHSFYQNGNQWIDSTVQQLRNPKRVRIQLNSKEYFELAAKKPEVSPWLALGQNVQFALNETIYEVFDQDTTTGTRP